MIQHVSFDLWLTLIKSNPLYKVKKAEALREFCANTYGIPNNTRGAWLCLKTEVVINYIKKVGKYFDFVSENFNVSPMPDLLSHTLLKEIVNPDEKVTKQHAEQLTEIFAALQLEYLPELISDRTIECLQWLENQGITMNVASNTGFSSGVTMRRVLDKLAIGKFFNSTTFSEEVRSCKPSGNFFNEVWCDVFSTHKSEEVLHVGDNALADIDGAAYFGFKTFHITEGKTIVDVIDYIKNENRIS